MNIDRIHLSTVDSTQEFAKRNLSTFSSERITCITAERQTQGRGRQGHTWLSPPGNLAMTLVVAIPSGHPNTINLAQIFSLSVIAVLESLGCDPQIRWPNDLLIAGHKIAGVLCEIVQQGTLSFSLLGLGLNVALSPEELSQIGQPAISLLQICGQPLAPLDLVTPLLHDFTTQLSLLWSDGFHPFLERYRSHLAFLDAPITLRTEMGLLSGLCRGISDEGFLILETEGGELSLHSSGLLETN